MLSSRWNSKRRWIRDPCLFTSVHLYLKTIEFYRVKQGWCDEAYAMKGSSLMRGNHPNFSVRGWDMEDAHARKTLKIHPYTHVNEWRLPFLCIPIQYFSYPRMAACSTVDHYNWCLWVSAWVEMYMLKLPMWTILPVAKPQTPNDP